MNFHEIPFGWSIGLPRGWTHSRTDNMTVGSNCYFSQLICKGAQNYVCISCLLHCSRKSCLRQDKLNKTNFLMSTENNKWAAVAQSV
jgi:hypothetical protein